MEGYQSCPVCDGKGVAQSKGVTKGGKDE